jgi:hypothetical protein
MTMTRNIFKIMLSAAAISLVMVSCSDDDDYTPAKVPTNNQVYFNYADNNTFSIEENQESVSVKVYRIKTDKAVSIKYTAEQPDGQGNIFVLPSSIDFKAGENVTDLVIGIDFAKVVPKDTYTLNLTIDSEESSPYGNDSSTVVVEYFEKGDPLRDAICGFYDGAGSGGEYFSNTWYYTEWNLNYGSDGVDAVRLLPGDERDEVLMRNYSPTSDDVHLTDVVGKVTTLATEEEAYAWWCGDNDPSTVTYPSSYWNQDYTLLGYITFEPQPCGTYTLDFYGVYDYDLTFASAWATGTWCSTPTDAFIVPIVGVRNADGSYVVKQIDFTTYGWCYMFYYPGYVHYFVAYGMGVLDLE